MAEIKKTCLGILADKTYLSSGILMDLCKAGKLEPLIFLCTLLKINSRVWKVVPLTEQNS